MLKLLGVAYLEGRLKSRSYVTGPRKTPLNAGIPEFIFIVESDKAFSKLQNDTKIDLLAIFYPEICSRERYEVLQRPLE